MFGSAKSEHPRLTKLVRLFRKNSNLCDHNPPTSQTDGQTTCDRKTALCTKVYRAVIRERSGALEQGHDCYRSSFRPIE